MKKLSSAVMIFFFMGLLMAAAMVESQQTADSCSSNLNLNTVGIPFDTTSLNCLSVWDSQNFILRYSQASADVWSYVLSVPSTTAYIAIGFSSDGQMVGSSAVVGWISSTGSASMKQYALQGQSSSQVKADQGTLSLISASSLITTLNNRTFMAFQLNTAQPQSKLLYAVGPQDFVPGPDSSLTEHQSRVSTTINYVSGQSKSGGTPHSKLRKSHGFLNMLSWGILMIIGALVARHCREWDPLWFYVHIAIQSSAFVLGLIGIITGLLLEDRIGVNVSTHKGLGLFVFVLGCLQVMAILARPKPSAKLRKYWNWYHQSVGRVLFIFAVANIFYGIHLGEKGNGWKAGYGIVLALLVITSIALEIRLFRRK